MSLQVPQRSYFATAANTPTLFDGFSLDNQAKQQQLDAARAFQGGLPTDASGNPDYGAMASRLFQKGDFTDANNLMQTSLSQQMMRAAQVPSAVLGGGQPAPAPSSSPTSSYTKPSPGFDSAVSRTLGFEGGFNKSDKKGTPSNYGINQGAHPNFRCLQPDAGPSQADL